MVWWLGQSPWREVSLGQDWVAEWPNPSWLLEGAASPCFSLSLGCSPVGSSGSVFPVATLSTRGYSSYWVPRIHPGSRQPSWTLESVAGPILSHLVAGLPGSLSPAQHTNVGTHAVGARHRSWQRADRRPLRHLGLSVPTGCSVRLLMLGTSLNTQRPQREGNAAAIWAWESPGGQAGVP